jgi:probable F420-dependent oxidoreductase
MTPPGRRSSDVGTGHPPRPAAPRPFRFGLQARGASSAPAWRELARKTEALGYSTLYVPDHFHDMWGPMTALTVAAEATTTLRVGSLVLANDFRHPVVVAKESATLDLVSEGRMELGLGAGWSRDDYDMSGIPLDAPSVRVARMEEAVVVIKGLWTSDPFSFEGEHYTVRDARGQPRPHRAPHPTLVIGGGSQRVLRFAGKEADVVGVNLNMDAVALGPGMAANAVADRFDRRIGWVREGAGERFPQIELQLLITSAAVTDDAVQFVDRVAAAFGVERDVVLQSPVVLAGSVASICDQLEERRERWGFTYVVVQRAQLDAFAPVVERLAGR